jgi:hypothetical protein
MPNGVKECTNDQIQPNDNELKLPALEEADVSRSIVTIEDVAWGRWSKTLHAENKHDISLPPLSSILQLTPSISKDLPNEAQARILVRYHTEHLCWFHNSLHTPSFLNQCEAYWSRNYCEDPLWLALYLSVLSVSSYDGIYVNVADLSGLCLVFAGYTG